MNNLFELNINNFTEICIYCESKLTLEEYYFYGWRSLYDCHCSKCKANFLIDMPIFSGIPYPAIYDKDKKKIVNDVATWWGEPLENISLKILKDDVISNIKINMKKDKLIVFNLLDFVFGHSFMRLERLTYYIDNEEYIEYDFLVLIPSQLRYLLSKFEDKISIIEIKISFPKYRCFYTCIDEEVKNITQNYSSIYCEMLKYSQQEFLKLEKLNLPITKWVDEIKKIVIVYRKDRTVGATNRAQYVFYKKLICLLNTLNVEVIIIGDKDTYYFSKVNDIRVNKFESTTDNIWNEACSGGITIGVHGSNMLIPSLCSSYNIEFVNIDKLYNFGQATAFLETLNQQETIQKYRYIYGNEYLSDINPKIVYELIKSIVIKMNSTFNAVNQEKYGDLNTVRKLYKKYNSVKSNYSFYERAIKQLYNIRKKLNI